MGAHHPSTRIKIRRRTHPVDSLHAHKSKWAFLLDKMIYAVAVLGPLATIPQIWDLYTSKHADGVSPLTWAVFTLFSFPWLFYGLVHKENALVISSILWIVLDAIVVAQAVLYA